MDRLSDGELYAKRAEELVRFATGLVGPSDAADVVSSAVVRCLASTAFRGATDPRAYLYRCVLNEARIAHRSAFRRRSREARALAPSQQDGPDPRPEVLAAVATLSVRQRAVVVLTYWADLDVASVAGLLGVSEGSVHRHLARARAGSGRFSMTDLEGRIRAVVAELVESAPPAPPFPGPARVAAARRRRLLAPMAALLAVAALVVALVDRSGHTPAPRLLITGPPPAGSIVGLAADHRLVLLGPDGVLLKKLSTDWGVYRYLPTPTITPDATTLYIDAVGTSTPKGCAARTEQVFSIPLSTHGSATPIVNGISPALSPDGRWLAYVRGADRCGGENELVVRQLGTGRERVLSGSGVSQPSLLHFLSWAPDSRHLGFQWFGAGAPRTMVIDTETAASLNDAGTVSVPAGMAWAGYLGATGDMLAVTPPPNTTSPTPPSGPNGQSLVTFDPATGRIVRTLLRLPGTLSDGTASDGAAEGVASDRSGRNLLLTTTTGLYRWSDGASAPTKIATGIVSAVWAHDPAGSAPTPTTTAPTPTTESAAVIQPGCYGCTSVSFLDPLHGWAIRPVSDQDPTSISVTTTDGGRHWATAGVIVPLDQVHQGLDAFLITFADAHNGWAWGPGLRTTHDGGRTWTDQHPSGEVRALAVVGDQAWALEAGVSIQPCPIPEPCPIGLWSTSVQGGPWHLVVTPPLLGIDGGQLLVPDPADAYLYIGLTPVAAGYQDPAPDLLLVSHDQGRSWTKLPATPCTGGIDKILAASSASHLWFGRGEGPFTFQSPTAGKSIYRSDDSGQHWQLVADTGPSAGPPARGSVGCITDRRHLIGLAISDPSTAWIALGGQSTGRGSPVLVTRDGGHTWADVPDLSRPDDMAAQIVFVDPLHGSALLSRLYTTTDGGLHWQAEG